MIYEYFVSFYFRKAEEHGLGNHYYESREKIRGPKMINELAEKINGGLYDHISIINIQPLGKSSIKKRRSR